MTADRAMLERLLKASEAYVGALTNRSERIAYAELKSVIAEANRHLLHAGPADGIPVAGHRHCPAKPSLPCLGEPT